ncbi:MAG TPA: DUF389 domain-containing protein [Ferruginibacter sp.]|nr:DUF389 domain-containing protein [Ferruginibacter sp.]HRN92263.1 DUF389 domain-containing protein [Ferruginibacter sp.]HRO06003.1 DUF389 domain-containing protein [Ferruginibacter sp.]HRO97022.1 DUF389 domain-containing protein [Ferruginibacter sp.]HRP49886.1 DUF389 domain-containing protein [Ferruginibacter sp.]
MSNAIFDFINLHNGEEDKAKVLENVKANTSFRGSNLWILACAIVIASIGLNVNSTAVIIGAMLISPLMGPIVGTGFALGTFDFVLLKKSGKNLLISTFVSLFVASCYFFISPFKDTQSELLARTTPNIYDVLIAFFGGLVGVIAITRVEKGNPIPGVAIATALMPPLCTAGYGLAIGKVSYFLGAFYLYTINCFFICIATFFIVKYLKYPPVSMENKKWEKKIRRGITILVFIMIVPSFYMAYNLFYQKKFTQKVNQYITEEFTNKGHTVIYQKVRYNQVPRSVELALLSKRFNEDEIVEMNKRLALYDISNTRLIIKQDDTDIKGEILKEINGQKKLVSEQEMELEKLRRELERFKLMDSALAREVNVLFPEVSEWSVGRHLEQTLNDSIHLATVVIYRQRLDELTVPEEKFINWLRLKLNEKHIRLIKME